MLEYQLLQKYAPVGIYMMPAQSDKTLSTMIGAYFCKQGIYQDAVIKFKVLFPENYPKNMPRV